jgi:hypothetical protein
MLWMLVVAALLTATASPAFAQPSGPDPQMRDPEWTRESGTEWTLFPAGDVYPVYVADPHRPVNAMLFRFYRHLDIPGTSMRRTGLSGGGRFGMLRIDMAGPAHRSWQVSLDAGLDALFDSEYSDDAIGWDGNYGLTFTTASSGAWSFKVAVLHVSAHIGDEYEERMHRTRIDYTREEVAVGVGWTPSRRWRVYGESGRSYVLKMAEQEPWRVQSGVEYEAPPALFGGRFAWYGALDVASMQERGWRIDRALQGGIVARAGSRAYRLMIELYAGRPTVAEFFKQSETSVTVGIRIDL